MVETEKLYSHCAGDDCREAILDVSNAVSNFRAPAEAVMHDCPHAVEDCAADVRSFLGAAEDLATAINNMIKNCWDQTVHETPDCIFEVAMINEDLSTSATAIKAAFDDCRAHKDSCSDDAKTAVDTVSKLSGDLVTFAEDCAADSPECKRSITETVSAITDFKNVSETLVKDCEASLQECASDVFTMVSSGARLLHGIHGMRSQCHFIPDATREIVV